MTTHLRSTDRPEADRPLHNGPFFVWTECGQKVNAVLVDNEIASCPVCSDTLTIAVAGPDENGQYDVDDCPCQTIDDLDPEERWYALYDGWVS